MILSMSFATLRGWPLLSCNDGANDCIPDSRRLLGLGVQALARDLLSRRPAAEALVRTLCRRVRHGRDQQQLLPLAERRHIREVAQAGAAGFLLRGQGEPLSYPGQETEGVRGAARADDGGRAAPGRSAWADALPAPAGHEAQSRAPRKLSEDSSGGRHQRLRIPQRRLV